MKILKQKGYNLISSIVPNQRSVDEDLYDVLNLKHDFDIAIIKRIHDSRGNSYIVDTVEEAKKYSTKATQLFFIYNAGLQDLQEVIFDSDDVLKRDLKKEFAEEDIKTSNAIIEGFDFDGQSFSLSQKAQHTWHWINILHQLNDFGDSQEISTKDGLSYTLTSEDLPAFLTAAMTKIFTTLAAGRTNKIEFVRSRGGGGNSGGNGSNGNGNGNGGGNGNGRGGGGGSRLQ